MIIYRKVFSVGDVAKLLTRHIGCRNIFLHAGCKKRFSRFLWGLTALALAASTL